MERTKPKTGVIVTVEELIALRRYATKPVTETQTKLLHLPGQRLTRSRGRGIEFDSCREYHAGDDIRNMAWRVSAKTGKPHIKVYQEDRERPVWLVVDLSPSLYFGTRTQFKSVCALKRAALIGWSTALTHERIGTLITTTDKIVSLKPHASETHFLHLLKTFASVSQNAPPFTEKNRLCDLLSACREHIQTGSLVHFFSDFDSWNSEIEAQLNYLRQRMQLHLFWVYDPLEASPPPPGSYRVTDGNLQANFDTTNATVRCEFATQFSLKKQLITQFAKKNNIRLTLLCTNEINSVPAT
jgi:uncharacterized protein (DUF58 family)